MKDLLLICALLFVHIGGICAQPLMDNGLSSNDEPPSLIEMKKDSGVFIVDKIVRKHNFFIIHMSDGEKRIKVLSSKNKSQENTSATIKLRRGHRYYIKTTSLLYINDMMPNAGIRLVYNDCRIKQYSRCKWFNDICTVDGLNGLYIDNSVKDTGNDLVGTYTGAENQRKNVICYSYRLVLRADSTCEFIKSFDLVDIIGVGKWTTHGESIIIEYDNQQRNVASALMAGGYMEGRDTIQICGSNKLKFINGTTLRKTSQ